MPIGLDRAEAFCLPYCLSKLNTWPDGHSRETTLPMKDFLKQNAYPIIIFGATRLLLILIGVMGFLAFPLNEKNASWRMSPDNLIFDVFARWDSGWYASIVEYGYTLSQTEQNTTAFFPFYPLLVWLTEHLVGNILLAGLFVSNVSFLLACIYFYKVSLALTGDEAASKRALLYLCVFPTTFFFSSLYTESLFLLLAVASYYYALKRNWLLAGILAAACSSTRVVGIVMWGVLGLEWMKSHGWTIASSLNKESWFNLLGGLRKDWIGLVFVSLAPLGLLAYILYLNGKFGAPFAFLDAQAFWGREFNGLFPAIFESARKIAYMNWLTGYDGIGVPIRWRLLLEFGSLIAGVFLGILAWKRFGESLGLFTLIGILLPASSSFDSLPRYFLVLFPAFLVLGALGKREWLDRSLLVYFGTLLCLCFALFANWYFIA